MINTQRITNQTDKLYNAFKSIYSASFPIYEQRTELQQLYALKQQNCHINCYIENNIVIGFIVYWELGNLTYIEHYAIHPDLRGQNYGTKLLNEFINNTEKQIILEIDPLIDEVAEKRYHFYKKLGFIKNNFKHTHPAYREGFEAHELILLTTQKIINKEDYDQFNTALKSTVMNIN